MREAFKAITCFVNFAGLVISVYAIYDQMNRYGGDMGGGVLIGIMCLINIVYIFITERPKSPKVKPLNQWYISLWLKRKRLEEERRIAELEDKN